MKIPALQWVSFSLLIPSICISFSLCCSAQTPATLLETAPGTWMAAADMGWYNRHDFAEAVLQQSSVHLKKRLDLSSMDETVWDGIRAAEISVFLRSEGAAEDEDFEIVLNGHVYTFPARGWVHEGQGWFQDYEARRWFDFPVKTKHLARGVNEIEIRMADGKKTAQNRVKIGIDIFEDLGNSSVSFDGGKTWQQGPLNRVLKRVGYPHYGHRGELMVRLNLYEDAEDLGKRPPFSHDDLPALPPIDLNPPVKPLAVAEAYPATYTRGELEDVLENGWMRLRIAHADGLALTRFVHKPMGAEILTRQDNPFFVLDIDSRRVSSRELTVLKRTQEFAPQGESKVRIELRDDESGLLIELALHLGTGQELRAGLYLQNESAETLLVKAAFPMLSGIGWSEGFGDDYYMFPYASGAIANRPAKFLSPYGGGTGSGGSWMQPMASYSPSAGGGVYLFPRDQSGGYKVLHLTRTDASGADPAFAFQGLVFNMLTGQATAGYALLDPLPTVPGTGMAVSYMQRELEPGDRWILPTTAIGVMNGGWQAAMEAYRHWFESWCHKRPWPGKLSDRFAMSGDSLAHLYRDEAGYHTNLHRWGDLNPLDIPGYFENTPDLIDLTSWWEWDRVTDEYMEEMRDIAANAGKDFKLWPGRHSETEGRHYNWGNQGAYGLQGYNERWGGLATFRQWICDMKAKDLSVVLYINEGEACLSSEIGREYGADWSIMWPEGTYFWPFMMWEMCIDNPLWRNHLADTCSRIVAETGSDGVFIDEFGGAARICLNPRHEHTFAERPGDYVTFQAQAEACRQIRQAVDRVDPDAVLLTESTGIDVMWQYLDACGNYDLSASALTGHRAGNWDGFAGLNIARFYFPRHKHYDYEYATRHPEWRFFNATGAFNREFGYKNHEIQILRENADAISTLEPRPMIPTLLRRVYVNEFPAKDKTIYMVYNARREPASGRLMEIDRADGFHMVDLLRCRAVDLDVKESVAVVPVDLPARSVTCLAYLPEAVSVRKTQGEMQVQVAEGTVATNGRIVDDRDNLLAEFDLQDGWAAVETGVGGAWERELLVKVYDGNRLVDAVANGVNAKGRSGMRILQSETPDGADLDVVLPGETTPAFRVLLPEGIRCTTQPGDLSLEIGGLHRLPGVWRRTDAETTGTMIKPDLLELTLVLEHGESSVGIRMELKNLSPWALSNVEADVCANINHLPGSPDWCNRRFIPEPVPLVRREQAAYWFEEVTPGGLKAFTGQSWEGMHLFEDRADVSKLPPYFFVDNPSQPAFACAVPSLDEKTLFYQAWNTPCRAQAPFPGNACMHLHPHIADTIEPHGTASIKGRIGLFDGDFEDLKNMIKGQLGLEE